MEPRGRRSSLGNARRTITRRKTSETAIYFKEQFLASARASTRSTGERLHALKSVETRRGTQLSEKTFGEREEPIRFFFFLLVSLLLTFLRRRDCRETFHPSYRLKTMIPVPFSHPMAFLFFQGGNVSIYHRSASTWSFCAEHTRRSLSRQFSPLLVLRFHSYFHVRVRHTEMRKCASPSTDLFSSSQHFPIRIERLSESSFDL